MIQFNLLPDVKKEYIKARRTRRLISSFSFLAAAISIGVTFLLFSVVQFGQKSYINGLTDDIQAKRQTIDAIPDISKVLTVQNQLNSIESIHQQKPAASRLFDYLVQLTPVDVKITNATVDFQGLTMRISGSATDLATVNKFADTLKFTTYEISDSAGNQSTGSPFTNVVTQLNRDVTGATYTIDMMFDGLIFNNTQTVNLIIPATITTRSSLNLSPVESRNDLFETPANGVGGQ